MAVDAAVAALRSRGLDAVARRPEVSVGVPDIDQAGDVSGDQSGDEVRDERAGEPGAVPTVVPEPAEPVPGAVLLLGLAGTPRSRERALAAVVSSNRPWVGVVEGLDLDQRADLLGLGACEVLPGDAGLDAVATSLEKASHEQPAGPAPTGAVLRRRVVAALSGYQGAASDGAALERLDSLTPREREVLELLGAGRPVRQIAQTLGSSPATVRSQVRSVRRKLGVHSQLAAVAALRGGDAARD